MSWCSRSVCPGCKLLRGDGASTLVTTVQLILIVTMVTGLITFSSYKDMQINVASCFDLMSASSRILAIVGLVNEEFRTILVTVKISSCTQQYLVHVMIEC